MVTVHACSVTSNSLCSPPGSSVHGILQARMPEWVARPPPGDLPDIGIEPTSLVAHALAGRFFTTEQPEIHRSGNARLNGKAKCEFLETAKMLFKVTM